MPKQNGEICIFSTGPEFIWRWHQKHSAWASAASEEGIQSRNHKMSDFIQICYEAGEKAAVLRELEIIGAGFSQLWTLATDWSWAQRMLAEAEVQRGCEEAKSVWKSSTLTPILPLSFMTLLLAAFQRHLYPLKNSSQGHRCRPPPRLVKARGR